MRILFSISVNILTGGIAGIIGTATYTQAIHLRFFSNSLQNIPHRSGKN